MKPSIQELVRLDLVARETLGRHRYGTSLYPFNGRDALLDAYEEALDLACYLRQYIEEGNAASTPVSASKLPPHFAPARQHAESECGWFCNHDTATGLTQPTRNQESS